eukprot:s2560_g12.t1
MRNPRKAVSALKTWQDWGSLASRALNEVAGSTDAIWLARCLGTDMSCEEAKCGGEGRGSLRRSNEYGRPMGSPRSDRLEETLGIQRDIEPRGVFPAAGQTKAQEASAEYLAARGTEVQIDANYKSFHQHESESQAELRRLAQEGHIERIGPWTKVIKRWPKAMATKLATLVKLKSDGTQKVRFIADMRRSGINAMAQARERIVLPRGTDYTRDILDMLECGPEEIELYTADFTDAFLNLGIHPVERGFAVIKSGEDEYSAYRGADRGRQIKWIGAIYQVIPGGVRVAIDAERIQKLTHTVQEGLKPKGLVHGMRSLAGELSWIAGLIPTIRPFVNMIWAAIYEMGRQNALVKQGRSGARIRPADAVFAKSVHIPLHWMRLFLQGHHGGLQRVRRVSDRYAMPQWVFRTDASTTGMGGILLDHQGKPVRWWAAPLPEGALQQLQVQAGDPGLMTVYELLALLCSVHIWKAYVRNCRLGILAQLDSESALRVAVKLASPHAAINRVAAELALLLEELCADAITGQHWPNEVNVEADALSRLGEGHEVPPRLRALPRDWAPTLHLRLPAASISKQLDWHSERELRGGNDDGDEPGGGKGKGRPEKWPTKKAAKAARDRERGRQRREKWRTWQTAAFPSTAYKRALDMGTAPSTRKAHQTRLRTSDMVIARLQREGLLEEGAGGHRLSGSTAKAGVAFLKAKGYRSAELYLSAAMRRHRLTHRVDEPLTQAAQDAIRLAKRGRGPPRKRQPMPFPKTDHPAYPALATGICVLTSGERMTEKAVMTEVESVAKAAGEPLTEGDGPRFGTHSMRVAGAIIAFQAGLDENTIKALGRWESTRAMLGYLRGIPYIRAAGATKHMARALTGGHCGPAAVEVLRPIWAEMSGWSLAARDSTADRRAGEEAVEDGPQVRHCLTGLVHRSGVLRGPPEGWSTRCGWKWADLGVAGNFGSSSLCSKCYGNR